MIVSSIIDKEKNVQDNHRRIFLDMATDVLYLMITQDTSKTMEAPKQKRIKTVPVREEILNHISKKGDQIEIDSIDEKMSNWMSAVSCLLERYACKVPTAFMLELCHILKNIIETRGPTRIIDERQHRTNSAILSNAFKILEHIYRALYSTQCKEANNEFWTKNMHQVIMRFISDNKEFEVMRHALSLLSCILRNQSIILPSTFTQTLLGLPYFQDHRNVCNESLLLLITISTINKEGERQSHMLPHSNELLQWIFDSFRHLSGDKASIVLRRIDPCIINLAVLTIINPMGIDPQEIERLLETNKEIDPELERDSIETLLNNISALASPFDGFIGPRPSKNNVIRQGGYSFNAELLNAMMQYSRSRCEEYINNSIGEDDAMKKKKKGTVADHIQYVLHFCCFCMGMLVHWPSIMQFLKSNDESFFGIINKLLQHVSSLLPEMGQDVMAWIAVQRPLSSLLQLAEHKSIDHLMELCKNSFKDIAHSILNMLSIVTNQFATSMGNLVNNRRQFDNDSDIIVPDDDDFTIDSQSSSSSSSSSSTPTIVDASVTIESRWHLISLSLSILSKLGHINPDMKSLVCQGIIDQVYKHANSFATRIEILDCLASMCVVLDDELFMSIDYRFLSRYFDMLGNLAICIGRSDNMDNFNSVIEKIHKLLFHFGIEIDNKNDMMTDTVRASYISKF